MVSSFLKNVTEGKSLRSELKQLPKATKGRIHFLSPDSDKEYLRMSKGKDVHGKSVLRQCVSIPFVEVPEKLLQILHAANGNDTAVDIYLELFLLSYYSPYLPYFSGYSKLGLTQLNPQLYFPLNYSYSLINSLLQMFFKGTLSHYLATLEKARRCLCIN